MILAGARVATSATRTSRLDLLVRQGQVFFSRHEISPEGEIDLSGFLILPGLINAHDHLELNLFPRLGRGPYPNATAWADDIYRPDEAPVKQHLGVPKRVRLFWGGMKNLLSGVTTVAQHNPYHPDVFDEGFPIRVVKHYSWAHSLRFSNDWQYRYRQRPAGAPFIIHAAEGLDEDARREIYQLDAASALGRSTVVVHGVALRREELMLVRKRGASLIWCPSSNDFTLGRTLSEAAFSSGVPIALGTDSALTAEGDLTDELRRASQVIDPVRLYGMVTSGAARVLCLGSAAGCIRNGGAADLLVVPDRGQAPAEALLDLRPQLVIVNGHIDLISETITERMRAASFSAYQVIEVEDRGRWLTPFNISGLIDQARQALDGDLRLAGKAVIS